MPWFKATSKRPTRVREALRTYQSAGYEVRHPRSDITFFVFVPRRHIVSARGLAREYRLKFVQVDGGAPVPERR